MKANDELLKNLIDAANDVLDHYYMEGRGEYQVKEGNLIALQKAVNDICGSFTCAICEEETKGRQYSYEFIKDDGPFCWECFCDIVSSHEMSILQ